MLGKQCKTCLHIEGEGIKLDPLGVCDLCNRYNRIRKARHSSYINYDIEAIINKIKDKNKSKEYDVIVGVSGGVDSTYVLSLCKQLDLRILAFHVDTGWNSATATANIKSAIKILNIPLYTDVINWNQLKELQRAFICSGVKNMDIPQDNIFKASQYLICKKYRWPTFVSGRSLFTDLMMPPSWVYPNSDLLNILDIYKIYGRRYSIKQLPFTSLFFQTFLKRFTGYNELRLLDLINYKRKEAEIHISSELDWKPYPNKHGESVYTFVFQNYILPKRWGIDKRRSHLSGQILNGELSRHDAMKLLAEIPDPSDIVDFSRVSYFLDKLDLSHEGFNKMLSSPLIEHSHFRSEFKIMQSIKQIVT